MVTDADLARMVAGLSKPLPKRRPTPVRRRSSGPRPVSYEEWRRQNNITPVASTSERKKESSRVGSAFHRVMDVLSRGNYASAEAFRRASNPRDNKAWDVGAGFRGFWSGLQGKSKTRFSQVLKEHGNAKGHEASAGLFLDIFADPLSYLGAGLVSKAPRLVKQGQYSKALETAKPDVVQLGVGATRFVKNRVGPGRKVVRPTGNQLRAGLRTANRARIGATATSIAPIAEGSAIILKLMEARAVDTPEQAARVVEAAGNTAARNAPRVKGAPRSKTAMRVSLGRVPTTSKIDIEAEARKLADLKYDKELGVPSSNPKYATASQRAFAAKGDADALDNIRMIEQEEVWQKAYTTAKKKLGRSVTPKSATISMGKTNVQGVAEKLATNPAPVGQPSKQADRMVETGKELDETATKVADGAAKRALHNLGPQRPKNFVPEFVAERQVNLLSRVYSDLLQARGYKKGTSRREVMNDPDFLSDIIKAYRYAEAAVEFAGKTARVSMDDATPLRLSSLLERNPELFESDLYLTQVLKGTTGKPELDDLRNALLAGAHAEDAAKMTPALDTVVRTVEGAARNLPDNELGEILDSVKAATDAVAKQAEVSPVARELMQRIRVETTSAAKGVRDEVFKVGEIVKPANTRASIEGVPNLATGEDMARAADKLLGLFVGGKPLIAISMTAIRGKFTGPADRALDSLTQRLNKTEDWIGVRLSSAVGAGPKGDGVVRFEQQVQGMRRGVVNGGSARAMDSLNQLANIFKGMPQANADDFFRAGMEAARNGDYSHPVAARLKRIEDLAYREGLTHIEMNEAIKRYYRRDAKWKPTFAGKTQDLLGNEVKLPPLESWRHWKLDGSEHPAQTMLKVEMAFQRAVTDKILVENFNHNFGVHKLKHPAEYAEAQRRGWVRAEGHMRVNSPSYPVLFPPDIAKQITEHFRQMREFDEKPEGLLAFYDKTMSIWKIGVTRFSPSYYIRNAMGSAFMNFLDGVRDVRNYHDSLKILRATRTIEVDPAALQAIPGGNDAHLGTVLFKHPKFGDLTIERGWAAWTNLGGRQQFATTDTLGENIGLNRTGFIARRNRNIVNFANQQEEFWRLAQFLHAIRTDKTSKTFEEAAQQAVARTHKSHADYNDLTKFERNVMRRVVPFYTWQRKIVPTLLEQMFLRPGRVMQYPKFQVAMAQHYGLELDDSNPFPQPENVMMPEWMQDAAQVPYGTRGNGNIVMGDPSNPFNDNLRELNHPMASLGGKLSPLIKAPLELGVRATDEAPKGRTFFGDIPVKNRIEYVEDQTPLLNTFIRLTRRDPAHGFQDRRENVDEYTDDQGTNTMAIINFLTAGGLQENTQRRQVSAEFEAKERERKRARKEAEKDGTR